ncbi:MAG: ATP-binding cassette domain-containing protein, partial [Duncaniella sp.]|nr:ATP-binding cassette domain-containing protein [Duncaniella sp.]
MGKVIDYKDVALHRQDLIALKHVNLSVEEGEFVYMIGKVGSGKSSLLKSIYADIPIASGEARVLDYDLNTIRLRDIPYLRCEIGIV